MAISIDGLVSGLDTGSIISKLMELERRPADMLRTKQVGVNEELAAWQEINTKLLAFETAAEQMNTQSELNSVKGTFTNSNSLQGDVVSISTNANAALGTFDIVVTQLATRNKHSMESGFTDPDGDENLSDITITMTDGSIGTFSGGTLNDMKDTINSSSLDISASVINTGTSSNANYILQITSDTAGSEGTFTVGTSGGQDSYLESVEGLDATFTLDGVTISRSTNSFSDVISGVTMDLNATGSGTITFGSDTTGVQSKIEDFVEKYNDVMDFVNDQFTYNQQTGETSALFGNTTLLNVQSTLRRIMSTPVAGLNTTDDTYTSLSQIGIKSDSGNKLVVDSNVLSQSLQGDIDAVKQLFFTSGSGSYTFVLASGATIGATYNTEMISGELVMTNTDGTIDPITLTQNGNFFTGEDDTNLEGFTIRATGLSDGDTGQIRVVVGIAEQIAYEISFITEFSADGAIFNARDHLDDEYQDFQDEIDLIEARIVSKQEDLSTRYALLEVKLSQLKGQSDFLSSQLSNLPGFGS